MIVFAPFMIADRPPCADIAMLDGLGVGHLIALERVFKARFDLAVECRKVVDAIWLGLKSSPRPDDIHMLRDDTLGLTEQVGVERQLQYGPALGLPREL